VTIEESRTVIAPVDAQDTSYAVFTVTADAEIELGTRVRFGFFAEFDTHQLQSNYVFPIGLVIEDFETGDLSAFNWIHEGATEWTATSTEVYEGQYSFVSGPISDYQMTSIAVSRTTTVPGTISFWYKVSSQANGDRLTFRLNGTTVGGWSGNVNWSRAEFNIPAGTNTLQWAYAKDGSGSAGQDCAWIDYITFPLNGG
jgi:hypothetical protein